MDSIRLNDQARSPRMRVRWPAAIKVNGSIVPAMIHNISEQGALINTGLNLNADNLIALMIRAKFGNKKTVIYARAVVRHTTMRKNDFYIGLQFKEISGQHRAFIKDLIEEELIKL